MKFIVLKKSVLLFSAGLLLACALLAIPLGENVAASVFFGDNLRKVPIYSVETEEKTVAISFDAAWGADKTQGILDILKEYDTKATFFLVGFWVEKYPEMVKVIADAGMEIGNHSNTHPDMVKLTQNQMELELSKCIELVNNIVPTEISLFRAPFGSYNNTLIDTAESLGMQTIQWDVDSLDWKGISATEITNRVMSKVKSGSIILFHNNSDHILEALPVILERLKMQGYKVTNVGNLVLHDKYEIDRAGVQKKK